MSDASDLLSGVAAPITLDDKRVTSGRASARLGEHDGALWKPR